MPELFPSLKLDQHVRELLRATGVNRADDQCGHIRMLTQVTLDPVPEHAWRDHMTAASFRQPQRVREAGQQALWVRSVGRQAHAPISGEIACGDGKPPVAQRDDERKAERCQLSERPTGGLHGVGVRIG